MKADRRGKWTIWALILFSGLVVSGLLTFLSGCDIGGCDCDNEIDDLLATHGQPDTFDFLDSTEESIYTFVYIQKLTDAEIADGVEPEKTEYTFRWGDNLAECCIKSVKRTTLSDTGTSTETGSSTETSTDTSIDTGTDTSTGTLPASGT